LLHSAADGDVHVFDNGLRLHRSHISPVQAARYQITNLHEPVEEAWFRKLSLVERDAFTFADVGAGIGYYAILMKLLRPSARVFCFEPLAEHARHLAANLRLNGIDGDSVSIFERAVSDRIGRQAFHREDFGSRLVPEATPQSSIVETTTLEAVVDAAGGRLDLVKIDVQGDEVRVIAGAGHAASRIGAWIVGTHSPELHQASITALRDRGLEILFEDAVPPHQPDGLVVATAVPAAPRRTLSGRMS
jgi:FkbM family methyltransferase